MLDRRAELTLDQVREGGWAHALFEADALSLLAERALMFNLRRALADIRDAFDHSPEVPERITAAYLRAAMG